MRDVNARHCLFWQMCHICQEVCSFNSYRGEYDRYAPYDHYDGGGVTVKDGEPLNLPGLRGVSVVPVPPHGATPTTEHALKPRDITINCTGEDILKVTEKGFQATITGSAVKRTKGSG